MKKRAHVIHRRDNVAVALVHIKPGEIVSIERGEKKGDIEIHEEIPYGHKFALKDIPCGEPVIKYGEVIGQASKSIAKSDHVHVHNLESLRGRGDLGEERNGLQRKGRKGRDL
jgi:altronate dehydratase small subunit